MLKPKHDLITAGRLLIFALIVTMTALAAIILAPRAGAQARDAREAREAGPTEIEKCQTISKPG
jgi:hypothetical protein